MVEISSFQNYRAVLQRPVLVGNQSYLSITQGISSKEGSDLKIDAIGASKTISQSEETERKMLGVLTYPQKGLRDRPGQPEPPWPPSVV